MNRLRIVARVDDSSGEKRAGCSVGGRSPPRPAPSPVGPRVFGPPVPRFFGRSAVVPSLPRDSLTFRRGGLSHSRSSSARLRRNAETSARARAREMQMEVATDRRDCAIGFRFLERRGSGPSEERKRSAGNRGIGNAR